MGFELSGTFSIMELYFYKAVIWKLFSSYVDSHQLHRTEVKTTVLLPLHHPFYIASDLTLKNNGRNVQLFFSVDASIVRQSLKNSVCPGHKESWHELTYCRLQVRTSAISWETEKWSHDPLVGAGTRFPAELGYVLSRAQGSGQG
jgi:hypothetical protein